MQNKSVHQTFKRPYKTAEFDNPPFRKSNKYIKERCNTSCTCSISQYIYNLNAKDYFPVYALRTNKTPTKKQGVKKLFFVVKNKFWHHISCTCVICLLTTDRQTVNYYSKIHALELLYSDSDTQESMNRQLYPSDSSNFPPLH